jgi:hypothetical protein
MTWPSIGRDEPPGAIEAIRDEVPVTRTAALTNLVFTGSLSHQRPRFTYEGK